MDKINVCVCATRVRLPLKSNKDQSVSLHAMQVTRIYNYETEMVTSLNRKPNIDKEHTDRHLVHTTINTPLASVLPASCSLDDDLASLLWMIGFPYLS